MLDMMPEIDEALVDCLEEEAEAAFRALCDAHPGEHFYIASINFDENMMARLSVFSEEALERAFAEQEITDEGARDWYRNIGSDALSAAYDYETVLSTSNELLVERNNALPEGAKPVSDMSVRISSASEALRRLDAKKLFGNDCICTAKISLPGRFALPPGGLN